jgi:hypothetical protein
LGKRGELNGSKKESKEKEEMKKIILSSSFFKY